ncbi:hypothetical protein G6031_15375 [Dietzia sp. CQ4]|nr:hypothetical protein [Dietzia sp. CQ4]MBB1035751.1 hypothetical protein [Dietzia sp. CQ4]
MVDTVVGFLSSDDPLRLFGVTMVGVSGRTSGAGSSRSVTGSPSGRCVAT